MFVFFLAGLFCLGSVSGADELSEDSFWDLVVSFSESAGDLDDEGVVGSGTIGTKEIATDYPIEEGYVSLEDKMWNVKFWFWGIILVLFGVGLWFLLVKKKKVRKKKKR